MSMLSNRLNKFRREVCGYGSPAGDDALVSDDRLSAILWFAEFLTK